MTDLLELAKTYGLPMALVVFYILRDCKREKYYNDMISKLLGELRDIGKNTIEANTNAFIDLKGVIQKCHKGDNHE